MATIIRKEFSREEARVVGMGLGIDWPHSPFDIEQFRVGMGIELEHGRRDGDTDVTHDDPIVTGKIALAHLREFPDYYLRLLEMERQAEGTDPGAETAVGDDPK